MRIIQILPSLSYGDAIGNDCLAIDNILKESGYESKIYAGAIGNRIARGIAEDIDNLPELNVDDIILYHLAIGWIHVDKIIRQPCRKIAIYHNVTPADFYKEYSFEAYDSCKRGIGEVKLLNEVFDYCLAVSEFNKMDLISYGYKCKIDVLPILIPFDDYKQEPSKKVIDRYKNEPGHNILCVGRVVPNKKIEDVIASFYAYKKLYDKAARLFIVGSYNENDLYYKKLVKYLDCLQINDVFFSGHIAFDEIIAYFTLSDVLVCMSEHEGFCVPLVEGMFYNIPILAYDSTAIGNTLGGAGILVKEKNYIKNAELINNICKNVNLRQEIVKKEQKRLESFQYSVIKERFLYLLNNFINSEGKNEQ